MDICTQSLVLLESRTDFFPAGIMRSGATPVPHAHKAPAFEGICDQRDQTRWSVDTDTSATRQAMLLLLSLLGASHGLVHNRTDALRP